MLEPISKLIQNLPFHFILSQLLSIQKSVTFRLLIKNVLRLWDICVITTRIVTFVIHHVRRLLLL